MTKKWRLDEIAQHLGAELVGDGSIIVDSLGPMNRAKAGQITFLSDSKYLEHLSQCQASAIVLTKEGLPYCNIPALIVENPYLSYAQLAQLFDTTPQPARGIEPSAVIAADVKMGSDVSIGANAVIESGVVLGDGVIVGAGCFIGCNTRIGRQTKIWANVTIYHEVSIGKQCLIQANTVIGSDGFGYANQRGNWIKIPQLGSVRIGDNVEIGASTTIDRGALDDTVIGNGVIIDNQCQIAHNVTIGDHTAIAGGVVMAGSLKLGRHCMVGGASVINGHMTICDNVTITGMGMVMRPISEPGVYSSGVPLQPNKKWRKTAALVLKIDEMNHRLKQLEKSSRKS